jgi:hypothetical protein
MAAPYIGSVSFPPIADASYVARFNQVGLFDFVYDWLIDLVPTWLWWVLITPLLLFLACILAAHFWPGMFS